MQKASECACPKNDCPRYSDCIACRKFHATVEKPPFCMRPENAISKELLDGLHERLPEDALVKDILGRMERL